METGEFQIGMAAREDTVAERVDADRIRFLYNTRVRDITAVVTLVVFVRRIDAHHRVGIGVRHAGDRRIAMGKRQTIQQIPRRLSQPLPVGVGRERDGDTGKVTHHRIGHLEFAHLDRDIGIAGIVRAAQIEDITLGRIGRRDGQDAVRHIHDAAVREQPRINIVNRTRAADMNLEFRTGTFHRIGHQQLIRLGAVG